MVPLTKSEKHKLKIFFERNKEWIENHSLIDEKNINELINKFGEFIEENRLNHSRALLMFIVEMKQESTKARIERSSARINNLSVNKIPLSATFSNNQTVNMWIRASGAELGELKRVGTDEVDYVELDRIIMARRKLLRLDEDEQTKEEPKKQKTK